MALNPRSQQLQTIAGQMPIANQAAANQMQQARQVQLQQMVGGQPGPQPQGPRTAQQLGGQQAQQAGQIQTAAAQQTQEGQKQVAQLSLAEQAKKNQDELFNRQLGVQKKQQELLNKLNAIDSKLKNELFDKQMTFQKDELGRTMWNERQLLDYKLTNAKNEEELRNYEQTARNLSQKKIKMLEMSEKKIRQQLEQSFTSDSQQLDQAQKKRLLLAQQALKEKIAKERAEQANRAAMYSTVGTIVGGVAGAVVGGPAGAMAGASIGGGLGSMAASQT